MPLISAVSGAGVRPGALLWSFQVVRRLTHMSNNGKSSQPFSGRLNRGSVQMPNVSPHFAHSMVEKNTGCSLWDGVSMAREQMRSCWYPSILACALICVRVLVLCLFQCGITVLGEWEGRWFAVRSSSKTGRRVSEAPHQSLVPPLCWMSSHVNRLAHDSLPRPPIHKLALFQVWNLARQS